MKSIGIALMTSLVLASTAAAQTVTTDCSWQRGRSTCTEKSTVPSLWPDARIIYIEPSIDPDAATRDRRWLAECVDGIAKDRYGVGRYVYKAPGCEWGILPSEQGRVLPAPVNGW